MLPSPQEVIVCIGALPILGSTFVHWLHIAELSAAAEPPASGPRPASPRPSSAGARAEVLTFLISGDWLLEEGARLGVTVTATQLKRAFDQLKAHAFRSRREFDAFLRSSGETVGDLLFRTELNMLSVRIQRRVAAQQRAIAKFVQEFKARWRAATICEPAYAVPECGRLQPGPL